MPNYHLADFRPESKRIYVFIKILFCKIIKDKVLLLSGFFLYQPNRSKNKEIGAENQTPYNLQQPYGHVMLWKLGWSMMSHSQLGQ
jgi:hypothetical protein